MGREGELSTGSTVWHEPVGVPDPLDVLVATEPV